RARPCTGPGPLIGCWRFIAHHAGWGVESWRPGPQSEEKLVMPGRGSVVLMLALVVALCWLSVSGQQAISAQEGVAPEDPSDDVSRKIAARRKAIEADLDAGRHEPWEGVFYNGSPTTGFARGWLISRTKGYVSTTRRIDMGIVKVKGDRIALTSEAPDNA